MKEALPLIGHGDAEASFHAALADNGLHHAWLIEGPRGIGKMQLALRLAATLLGAHNADRDHPVMRILLARSHPDLRLIERELNDKGKLKQDISVEQVRALIEFFTLKPALGGWRVGIIDAVDDLNRSGANALLKTLEEPPPKSALFLVYHGTLPVLPTLRSRCRTLRLKPLNSKDTEAVLELARAPREAADLARGRPGLGIRLSSEAGLQSAHATRALLRNVPKLKDSAVAATLQAASVDDIALEAFREDVLAYLAHRAQTEVGARGSEAAQLWLETARLIGEAEDLNMSAAQLVAQIIQSLYGLKSSE